MSGALEAWLADALGVAEARVEAQAPLAGGAIQENVALDVETPDGPRRLVLRRDAPSAIAASRSRADEFAILRAAHAAGVRVPEPVAFCDDEAAGGPFALMARVDGEAYGPKVVREEAWGGEREALGREIGRQLAMIHAVPVEGALATLLGPAPDDPARAEIALLRGWLDALGAARPGLEWGLRHAERTAPGPGAVTLAHRDFRTGNLMLDGDGLTAILDWEFAGWGDPMADLGWFCARCWRFSRPDREGGGLTSRGALYEGYRAAGGTVDEARIGWWELMAHLRWAVIALQQGARFESGAEPDLVLALTGRIADTLELDVLRMAA